MHRTARVALRCLLAAITSMGVAAFGPTQPQAVVGPCHVKDFFIIALSATPTDMLVDNTGEACRFIVLNPDLQLFQTAALVTSPPAHGRATAGLVNGGVSAEISYTPQPGYVGNDRFTTTIEPNDKAIVVVVTVRPAAAPR